MNYQTTVVLNKEGRWYVAKSVELGVASQGRTIDEAQKNLKEAVELFLEDQPEARIDLSKHEFAPLITTLTI